MYRDDVEALKARRAAIEADLERTTRERDEVKRLIDEAKLPVVDNLRPASKCQARWGEMTGGERVRTCARCRINVYKLDGMKRDEARTLMREREGYDCASPRWRPDGTILPHDCSIGVRNRRAVWLFMIVIGVFMAIGIGVSLWTAFRSTASYPGHDAVLLPPAPAAPLVSGAAHAQCLVDHPAVETGEVARWNGIVTENVACDVTGGGHDGVHRGLNMVTYWRSLDGRETPVVGAGTITGATSANTTFGFLVEIPRLDCGPGYESILVDDAPELRLARGMTIEAWIMPRRPTSWDRNKLEPLTILSKWETDHEVAPGYALIVERHGNVRMRVGLGGTIATLDSRHPIAFEKWTHIAVTHDGKSLRMYVNGEFDDSINVGPLAASTAPLVIGSTLHSCQLFQGELDDVALYGRPLSANEIAEHAHQPSPGAR